MRLRPIRPRPPWEQTLRVMLMPVIAAALAVGGVVAGCNEHGSSSQQDTRKFSPRSDTGTESIQLTPCQRSAAACFASGGLDTLTANLDGLAIDPRTGRFCFSFQEGCDRR